MKNEKLNSYVFHFNPYNEEWRGVKRENYPELFSGGKNVLKSKKIKTLIEFITKQTEENEK